MSTTVSRFSTRLQLCVLCSAALCAAAQPAWTQSIQVTDRSVLVPGAIIDVVPGERYSTGTVGRWLFGGRYRELWTGRIRVPVIDLSVYGGGVTAFRTGGFGQTNTLHFRNARGERFTFRSVDKTPARGLPEELRGTLVADVQQDLISSLHPGAALVAAPLLEAANVLHVDPQLVVLPYDERLGEFRDAFAGMLGYVEERPNEREGGAPGFAGLTSIVGDERIAELLEAGPANRVDSREFLRARLMDVLLGDRDRHAGQWRWGRVHEGERNLWAPIPKDRDQALIGYSGMVMAVTRLFQPKFVAFEREYPNMAVLTFNAWDLDRRFLPELTWDEWSEVATVIQSGVTDEVIAEGVASLPREYVRLQGDVLRDQLTHRRDELHNAAREMYELFLRVVEITGTDAPEVFKIRFDSDRVSIIAYSDEAGGGSETAPYYERVFERTETDEVRIYAKGGDDRVMASGNGGGITVRVIGGGGDDRFVDSVVGGDVRYYDHRGTNVIESLQGAEIDETEFQRPASSDPAHRYALDWGSIRRTLPRFSFQPDVGFVFGVRTTRWRYGFRKVPYQTRSSLGGTVVSGGARASFFYNTRMRNVARNLHASVRLNYSGYDIIRFHGFGNETSLQGQPNDFFRVRQQTFEFAMRLIYARSEDFRLSAGPLVRYATTDRDDPTLLGALQPFGSSEFGQVGGRLQLELDLRDRPLAPSRGIFVSGAATVYPKVWDVTDVVSEIHGDVAVYVSAPLPSEPTLALRVGAKKVWGDYPFHEAAYLGGANDLRGFAEQRFAGDAAAFGNVELRLGMLPVNVVVPGELGVFGLADLGRVWHPSDTGSKLHTAVGGGLWISFLNRANTLSIGVAHSEERTGVYVRSGFLF